MQPCTHGARSVLGPLLDSAGPPIDTLEAPE